MTEKEKTLLLEKKILEKKEIFKNSNAENIYCNYSDLMTLEFDYRKITGNKTIIDNNFLNEFYKNNKSLVDGPMNDTYFKIQEIKNNVIDKNLKELNNIVLFDILDIVNKKINNKKIINITNIEKSIDNTILTYNDIDNIINDFLKTTNYKYKDLYKNLKEQGLVFFTDKLKSFGNCYNDIDINSDYSYIMINKNLSVINTCLVIAHELGHIIEVLELKNNNINKKDLYNFLSNSVFNEVISTSYGKKCIDYLDNIGIDNQTIKKYRIQYFFNEGLGYANDIVAKKRNMYSIKRTYAMIINNYIDSIILPNKRKELKSQLLKV